MILVVTKYDATTNNNNNNNFRSNAVPPLYAYYYTDSNTDVNDAKKNNDNDTKKKIRVCFTQNESIRNIRRNCYNIAMTYPTSLHPELRHI